MPPEWNPCLLFPSNFIIWLSRDIMPVAASISSLLYQSIPNIYLKCYLFAENCLISERKKFKRGMPPDPTRFKCACSRNLETRQQYFWSRPLK